MAETLQPLSWFPNSERHVARGGALIVSIVLTFVVDEYREGDFRRQVLDQRVLDGEVESSAVLGDELVFVAQVFEGHAIGLIRLSKAQTKNAISTNNKTRTCRDEA